MPRHIHTRVATLNLTEEELKMIFKQFDANKDGQLDKEELKGAFQRLGANWRASRALYHADQNHDGVISEQELDVLVKYATKWGYRV